MKEEKEAFEVRDLRDKNRFFLDDEFFNGYVKMLGTNALGVYCALCRHADRHQKSYPSINKLAMELKLTKPTVIEWLKVLEYLQIIKKQRLGKQCTNRYYLLAKKCWRKDWEVMLNDLTTGEVKSFNFRSKMILLQGLNDLTSNRKVTQEKGNTRERYATPGVAIHENHEGDLVNKIISLFRVVNPSYERIYANLTQRRAVERLLGKFGEGKLIQTVGLLTETNGKKYAPKITTPLQLEDKLGNLFAYLKSEQDNRFKPGVVGK
jgi:DNA-binding transcriptional ArsR family regulator